jgi:hypothetical protein
LDLAGANAGALSLYLNVAEQDLGALTWVAGTAPSGTIAKKYRWIRIGDKIEAWFKITSTVAGVSVSSVSFPLPADMPSPVMWGSQPNLEGIVQATGHLGLAPIPAGTTGTTVLFKDSFGSVLVSIQTPTGGANASFVWGHLSYLAS